MEVLDLIYHQCFFTSNNFGRQPTTSQFFQLLPLPRLAVVAAAFHCALYEFATGKKVTVMLSQDEYWGIFCPSTSRYCITTDVHSQWSIVLLQMPLHSCITHGRAASYHPPKWCSSAILAAPQSLSALITLDQRFDNSFSAGFCFFSLCSSSWMGATEYPPQPQLGAPLLHSRLFTFLPFGRCSAWVGCSAE